MAERFEDRVEVLDDSGETVVDLDATTGQVSIGSSGEAGSVVLRDDSGTVRIELVGDTGRISIRGADGREILQLSAFGDLYAGGAGVDGDIVLRDRDGNHRLTLDAEGMVIALRNADGDTLIEIGRNGNLVAGGAGQDGDLVLRDGEGNARVNLGGDEHNLVMRDSDGNVIIEIGRFGNLVAGGIGTDGDLLLRDREGNTRVQVGADEQNLVMRDAAGVTVVDLGRDGNLALGGAGRDGDIGLFPASAVNQANWDDATIHLNADTGDIILRNADAAEQFDLVVGVEPTPGTVMVLDDSGRVKPSETEYDHRVVGVVAGGGNFRPGIILDNQGSVAGRVPISVMGKVSVLADATAKPIRVGDLLTTSGVAGHAMRAERGPHAFGATLGKALSGLAEGRGMVDMLVSLR